MALDALASLADLPSAHQDDPDAEKALRVASAAIRDAAGVPISQVTATIEIPAPSGKLLRLPGPIVSVDTVLIDGSAVTDHLRMTEGLWRRGGWSCDPVPVTVTYTFGLAEIPDDLVDLAVQLAVAWLQHEAEGGGSTAGLKSARLDDAAEAYTDADAEQISPVYVPEKTARWLASRFGGSGSVVVIETLS